MLLGEPERTQGDLRFVLFGIPVRVHPFFWLVAVFLGANVIRTPWDLVIWVAAVFTSILVHELGHALVMTVYGFRPWITLYGLGGLASYNRNGAYSARGNRPLAQILVSAAGPGAALLLTAVLLAVLYATGHAVLLTGEVPFVRFDPVRGPAVLDQYVHWLVTISIAWSLLNLLPVYPLDGGQIAREVLLVANPREGIRQSLWLSIFTAAGLCAIAAGMWRDWFLALLFGYLAYANYMALQAYEGRGPRW